MLIVILGLPGSGKTSVGKELAKQLHFQFYDMDDFMPASFRKIMKEGKIVSEAQRDTFIKDICNKLHKITKKEQVVASLTLIKEEHWQYLLNMFKNLIVFQLEAPFELLLKRVNEREGHFLTAEAFKKLIDKEEPTKIKIYKIDSSKRIDQIISEMEEIIKEQKF